MSVTPRRLALKSLICAFKDSACALVLLLLKKFNMLPQFRKSRFEVHFFNMKIVKSSLNA